MQTGEQDRSARVNEVIDRLNIHSTLFPVRRERLQMKLADVQDSTLTLIQAAADWNAGLRTAETSFMYIVLTQSSEATIRETSIFRPLFSKSISSGQAREVVNGLHYLDRYKYQTNLEDLDWEEMEIATAFINITVALYGHANSDELHMPDYEDRTCFCIKSRELQDFIATHYRQADDIIGYITDRKTADPETIRKYLENGTALKNGVL